MESPERFTIPGYPKPPSSPGRREPSFASAVALAVFACLWASLLLLARYPTYLAGVLGISFAAGFVGLARFAPRRLVEAMRYGLIVAAFVGFFLFTWHADRSGGDALNGKIEGRQHYVAEHGRYRPVSPRRYWASAVLGIATLSLWPSLFCMPLAAHLQRRRWG